MVKADKEERSFGVVWPLMVAQTIGAFNDNVMKAMLPVMAAVQFGKASMDTVNQQVSILLILPFVVFAPFAGWLADRFSKRKVIVFALFVLNPRSLISLTFRYLKFVLIIGVSNIGFLILSKVFPNNVQFPKSINCLGLFFPLFGQSLFPDPPQRITGLIFIIFLNTL